MNNTLKHDINYNEPRIHTCPFLNDCECKLCAGEFNFRYADSVYSHITNTKFLLNFTNINLPPCKIKNLVYLITCQNCNIQYVGKTEKSLRERAYGHRSGVLHGADSAILLYKHFNEIKNDNNDHNQNNDECKQIHLKYQIIEIVSENHNILDRENYWIGKLMTVYPFGLNNQIKGVGNIFYKDFLKSDFNNPYFNFPSRNRRPGRHGNRRLNSMNKKNNRSDINIIVNNLYYLYKNFGIKKLLDSLKSLQKKSFTSVIENILYNDGNFKSKFKHIVFAFMGYIRNSSKTPNLNSPKNKIISTLKYSSKILDIINLNGIINSRHVKSKMPEEFKVLNPVIVYSYDKPIGSIICNYNSFLDNISDNDIFTNNKCICERVVDMPAERRNALNSFIYSPVGHIVTGDLEIVKHFANDKLAELCRKGFKYRIANANISWRIILRDIINTVNNLKTKLANKMQCDGIVLDAWSTSLIKTIRNKVFSLKQQFNLTDFIDYDFNKFKTDLNSLHKHFVITTIDKANNNYSFTCKKFYLSIIKKELGISGNLLNRNIRGNSVYEIQNDLNVNDLIIEHCDMNKVLDVKLSDKNKCIPKLYMILKFHKKPYKYRFIAGAKSSTTKTLSIQVVQCLKYLKSTHKRYCNTIYRRTGVNYFWSVDNSKEVVDKLNTINKLTSIHSFDFSTLYTNLPLDLVYTELCYIIDLHYDRYSKSGNQYINVNTYFNNATLSSTPGGPTYFDRNKLKKSLKFLLFNTYIKFGSYIFKQILGIPMGGNASPLIADLFLLSLEFKFMKNLVDSKNKDNLLLAKTLSNNSRYIDDILVCNSNDFKDIANKIYPNSIPLTQGNNDDYMENFLDINIVITNDKCILKIYHKVEDFDFNVISFPFPSSNIDNNITYNSYYSQLVRFCNICTKVEDFRSRAATLFRLLVNRGFDSYKLKHKFDQFRIHYADIILKFDIHNFTNRFLI